MRGKCTVLAPGADAHAASDAAPPQHRLNGERSRQTERLHPGLGPDLVDCPAYGVDDRRRQKTLNSAGLAACPGDDPRRRQQMDGEPRQRQGDCGLDQGVPTQDCRLHALPSCGTMCASPRSTRSLRKSRTSRRQVSASTSNSCCSTAHSSSTRRGFSIAFQISEPTVPNRIRLRPGAQHHHLTVDCGEDRLAVADDKAVRSNGHRCAGFLAHAYSPEFICRQKSTPTQAAFFEAIIPFEGRGENKLRGGEGVAALSSATSRRAASSSRCGRLFARKNLRYRDMGVPVQYRVRYREHIQNSQGLQGIAAKTSRGPGWRRRRRQSRGTALRADTSK